MREFHESPAPLRAKDLANKLDSARVLVCYRHLTPPIEWIWVATVRSAPRSYHGSGASGQTPTIASLPSSLYRAGHSLAPCDQGGYPLWIPRRAEPATGRGAYSRTSEVARWNLFGDRLGPARRHLFSHDIDNGAGAMPGGGSRRSERARILDRRERRAKTGAEAAWLAGTSRGRRRARPEPKFLLMRNERLLFSAPF